MSSAHSSLSLGGTSTTSSSVNPPAQGVHALICRLLGPRLASDESLVSSHYQSALALLSSSSASASQATQSELTIVEAIQKKLVREQRGEDVAKFKDLYIRLQKPSVLQNRSGILSLLFHLSEKPGASKFRKVAPFQIKPAVHSTPQPHHNGTSVGVSMLAANGGSSYLSSIHEIRSHLGPGYHPPLPPKPKSPIQHLLQAKQSASPPRATLRGSEKELLRELIYSFQGIEGHLLQMNPQTRRFTLKGTFPPSIVQTALKLTELGWLFNRIKSFCDQMAEERDIGLTAQSFVTALKNELAEFYRLLSTLEAQLQETEASLSLQHLMVWTLEPMNRLKLLVSIVEACQGLRGGALISTIYSYLHHGDVSSSDTVHAVLCTVCKPMYLMLLRWISDGTLEDPYNEFFIASDPKIQGDRLWHEKYSIRHSMIPKFLSLAWVKKILATGKNINYLHEVCKDNTPISGRDVVKASLNKTSPESIFASAQSDSLLHSTIQRAYSDTSSHVLSVLFTRYKFLDHMSAMRKYLLLGQGDIIRYLLELLEEELVQPASSLFPHTLAGILETAIRSTNAQFEDPDILERLDVRLLDTQPGDIGWDVFSLDYKVAGPIGTVFGPKVMNQYLMLFNALWRAKRIEWLLSCVWRNQACLHKMTRTVPELKPLLHIANLLASEMIHFIHQLAYYITFEVMECSWDILIKQLRKAESLDEIIDAHEEFLLTLMRQALLDEDSHELLTQLRAIYDRILEFHAIQNRLYAASVSEVEARLSDQAAIQKNQRAGQYGLTMAEEQVQKARKREFLKVTLPHLKSQLKIVSQSYQDMVRTFLLQLTCNANQALQFLSFRLDFNQHYKRTDARLGTPLTFQHMRESSLLLTQSFEI
eukprot:maker-scaffold281_size224178-snap-gene-1.36 protein:Tk10994 transcript:maker-scaffold281_size224178-snap-gene-1.36-mRNA-1 annotation:"gamma-tubulin complex component 3"